LGFAADLYGYRLVFSPVLGSFTVRLPFFPPPPFIRNVFILGRPSMGVLPFVFFSFKNACGRTGVLFRFILPPPPPQLRGKDTSDLSPQLSSAVATLSLSPPSLFSRPTPTAKTYTGPPVPLSFLAPCSLYFLSVGP